MKTYPNNHFSGIVCDPPYMINFMGNAFDKFKDNPAANIEVWKEALRICKPGSHLLAFGGDRTHHHMMKAIEDAGWVIRTCLYWIFGSGFPKSHNFGRKLGGEWSGYGTALKPAAEIIVLAMKPLEVTFAQNAEKWGVVGLNIDASRIGTGVDKGIWPVTDRKKHNWPDTYPMPETEITKGRWPANLILDEDAGKQLDQMTGKGVSRFFYCAKASSSERNEGCESIEEVECQTGCGGAMPIDDDGKQRDRFKKKSRNNHPTVKPLRLMQYLLRLIAPPSGGIILDPFAGSGTTVVAAKRLGIECIGIEKSDDYCQIANARLAAASENKETTKQFDLFTTPVGFTL